MNFSGAGFEETAFVASAFALSEGVASALSAGAADSSAVAAGFAVSVVVDDDLDQTMRPRRRIANTSTSATRLEPLSFFTGAFAGAAALEGAGVVETFTRDEEREPLTGTGGTDTPALFFADDFFTALRTVAFFGAALRVALFLTADFLATAFFAVDFFAADFLTADFFAVDFFTATDISLSSGSGGILA